MGGHLVPSHRDFPGILTPENFCSDHKLTASCGILIGDQGQLHVLTIMNFMPPRQWLTSIGITSP